MTFDIPYEMPISRSAMDWFSVALRSRSTAIAAIMMALAVALVGPAAARAAQPETKPLAQPMQIVLVKATDSGCTNACPEWISAEGAIAPESGAAFRKVLKSIGNRKVPVFINSPGGSVEAALAIGRMLRARHLDIAVTRTEFDGCSPSDRACSRAKDFRGYRGLPVSAGALCASACPMLIAGGARRLVSSGSYVGVHEITLLERHVVREYKVVTQDVNGKDVERSRKLVSENEADPFVVKNAASTRMYREEVAQYYREMGVSDKIVDLAFATKASDIHWMTRSELTETRLVTEEAGGEALVGLKPPPVPTRVPITSAAQLNWADVASRKIDPPAVAAVPHQFEVAGVGDLPLDAVFDVELTFAHRQSEQTVGWSAMIRAKGLSQAAFRHAVRLEIPDGRGFSASPSIMDPPFSTRLHGEMTLREYCDLAQSSAVQIRLTTPKEGKSGLREVVGDAKKLPLNGTPWPDCAAATTPVAQAPAP